MKIESARGQDVATKKTRREKADGRKQVIRDALRACILRKGYAATSFNELAKEAGMSPSHLFYYYPGKEAVLEDLYRHLLARQLVDAVGSPDDPPEEQCHALVDFLFAGYAITQEDREVLMELLSLSLHNPGIEKIREEYTKGQANFLRDLFDRSPCLPGFSGKETALAATGLLNGLVLLTCFHEAPIADARKVLRKLLMLLGNFEEKSPGNAAKRGKSKRKGKVAARS